MSDRVVLDGELSLSNVLDGQGGTYSRYDWRGYSAYEVAVQEGFVGTKAEWLASLQGEDGTDGQDGDDYVLTAQDKHDIANLVNIPLATTTSDGLMSATDKLRLDDVYADYSSALTALGVIE